MSGPLHNPAASYDFGTWLWAVDPDAVIDEDRRALYSADVYADQDTLVFAHDRIEASYNAWCDEQSAAQKED